MEIYRAISIYGLIKIIIMAISFLSVPILTHIMEIEQYGRAAVLISIVSISVPIATLGTHMSFQKVTVEYPNQATALLRITRLLSVMTAVLISYPIWILSNTYISLNYLEFLIVIAAVISSSSLVLTLSCYHAQFKYKKAALINAARTTAPLLLLVTLAIFFDANASAFQRMAAIAFAEIAIIFLLTISFKEYHEKLDVSVLLFAIRYSYPFVISSSAIVIISNLDRIMIANALSYEESAVYSVSVSLGGAIYILWVGARQAFVPWIYTQYQMKNQKNIDALYSIVTAIMAPIFVIFSISAGPVIMTLVNSDFTISASQISYVTLISFLQFILLFKTESLLFFSKTKKYSVLLIIGMVINIAINSLFLKKFGIHAAYASTIMTYVFLIISASVDESNIDQKNTGQFIMSIFFVIATIPISIYVNLFFKIILITVIIIAFGIWAFRSRPDQKILKITNGSVID